MSGKTVEVDNTDAEGRLVLSDALWYASSVYKPGTVVGALRDFRFSRLRCVADIEVWLERTDVATLTGAMVRSPPSRLVVQR